MAPRSPPGRRRIAPRKTTRPSSTRGPTSGAKGDGPANDTAALQKGTDLSSDRDQKVTKVLFPPNGTYRLTKSLGTGTGEIFATDVSGPIDLRKPWQKAWCRQVNPEGDSDDGLAKNAGDDLWLLGLKSEGKGVRVATSAGGRRGILGAFIYGSGCDKRDTGPKGRVRVRRGIVVRPATPLQTPGTLVRPSAGL